MIERINRHCLLGQMLKVLGASQVHPFTEPEGDVPVPQLVVADVAWCLANLLHTNLL